MIVTKKVEGKKYADYLANSGIFRVNVLNDGINNGNMEVVLNEANCEFVIHLEVNEVAIIAEKYGRWMKGER